MSEKQRSVVVGVDDSPGAETALQWALADARRRKAPVRLVHTYQWRYTYGEIPAYGQPTSYGNDTVTEMRRTKQVAEQLVAIMVDQAREAEPDIEIDGAAIDGAAISTLLDESSRAAVLVLGSRHLKTLGSEVLGSVSAAVAARAASPTVVVRGPAGSGDEEAGVVVGVDGTRGAEALLRFGFEHASRHGTPLRAVLCWHPDLLATMVWRPEPPAPEKAHAWLSESLAGWREDYPDVQVHAEVVREHPVDGLIGASLAQQLLVVGSHGRHAMAGTLLGSVSQGVLHHASCPVAVVPTHD
ncbi:MAG: universal stress protein [Jatrophihabitantaceae bacterium]